MNQRSSIVSAAVPREQTWAHNYNYRGEGHASATVSFAACASVCACVGASEKEPVTLRDFGSFHLGGRLIEVTGQPVKEVVLSKRRRNS
jgi:hypothetical protein